MADELFLTDEDLAKYEEVNRQCLVMRDELKVVRERVEQHNAQLIALWEQANKLFGEIDRLYEGRLTDE